LQDLNFRPRLACFHDRALCSNLASRARTQHFGVGRITSKKIVLYKDRAAPPIGGTALHDGGVKTVQWTKREGHDSYQEVEVYIYKYI